MSPRPTLPEPVEIAKFWKNRRHDAIVVTKALEKARELGLLADDARASE